MLSWKRKLNEFWPRTEDLSHHSPNFFAENKDRFLRQILIRDIQTLTGRPLVVYYGSSSFNSDFRNEDVKRLYEVVHPFERMDVDLFLETKGGETDATEAIISCLKNLCNSYRVVVPGRAKSNGTLICLAADSIVMGPTSELGPIEPLVNFVPASVLISDEHKADTKHYDSRQTEVARYAISHSKALAKKFLAQGMMQGMGDDSINQVVSCLCSREKYCSHGSVIDAREARELRLKVEIRDSVDEIWKRYVLLHSLYKTDSELRQVSKFFEQESFSQQIVGDDPPITFNGR